MDLGLLYSNFAMDNKDLTLHTSPDGSAVFRDTDGQTYCTIRPYNHADPDLARDPFSTNRRFFRLGRDRVIWDYGGGRTDNRHNICVGP